MIITNYCFVIYVVLFITGLMITLFKWGEEDRFGWGTLVSQLIAMALIYGIYKGW